jgi:hypothetical protein
MSSRPNLRVALTFVVCCLSCGCISNDQVAVAVSPNGALKAFLNELNGGATTSFRYDVSVVSNASRKAERVASLYGAVRNAQAYGVDLHWIGNSTLEIRYLSAKSVSFIRDQVDLEGQTGASRPATRNRGPQRASWRHAI